MDDDTQARNRLLAYTAVRLGGPGDLLHRRWRSCTPTGSGRAAGRGSARSSRSWARSTRFSRRGCSSARGTNRTASVREAFLEGGRRPRGRRRLRDPARRSPGKNAGARAAERSNRGAGRRDRRGMADGRGHDRSARDAADGLCQCRDRSRRAGPARVRGRARALRAIRSRRATARRGRARWSRCRKRRGTRCSAGRGGATTSTSRRRKG